MAVIPSSISWEYWREWIEARILLREARGVIDEAESKEPGACDERRLPSRDPAVRNARERNLSAALKCFDGLVSNKERRDRATRPHPWSARGMDRRWIVLFTARLPEPTRFVISPALLRLSIRCLHAGRGGLFP